jgi:Rrf2 family iron-sulfur cluster assembly transcriptional regulator
MKLTRSVSYAIGILLQVAAESSEAPLTAARIARGCRFPPRFLYRILRRLVDAGLLQGASGPGGGYRLAQPTRAITLLQIVSAVDAPPEAARLVPVKAGHSGATALVNRLCEQSAAHFATELERVKLSQLLSSTEDTKPRKATKSKAAKKKAKRRANRGD